MFFVCDFCSCVLSVLSFSAVFFYHQVLFFTMVSTRNKHKKTLDISTPHVTCKCIFLVFLYILTWNPPPGCSWDFFCSSLITFGFRLRVKFVDTSRTTIFNFYDYFTDNKKSCMKSKYMSSWKKRGEGSSEVFCIFFASNNVVPVNGGAGSSSYVFFNYFLLYFCHLSWRSE